MELSTTDATETSVHNFHVRKSQYYGVNSEVSRMVREGRDRLREQRQALKNREKNDRVVE